MSKRLDQLQIDYFEQEFVYNEVAIINEFIRVSCLLLSSVLFYHEWSNLNSQNVAFIHIYRIFVNLDGEKKKHLTEFYLFIVHFAYFMRPNSWLTIGESALDVKEKFYTMVTNRQLNCASYTFSKVARLIYSIVRSIADLIFFRVKRNHVFIAVESHIESQRRVWNTIIRAQSLTTIYKVRVLNYMFELFACCVTVWSSLAIHIINCMHESVIFLHENS